ncbi:MAG: hypothetical protein M3N54_11030 [Acidobacteriota bacterium]|nr:hypothetical protein [Acidobacteriota bacterium]
MAQEKHPIAAREWITGLLLPLAIFVYTWQKDKADDQQRALDRITAIIHSLGSSVESERSLARSYIEYLGVHGQADPEVVSLLSSSISTAPTATESAQAARVLDSVQSHNANLAPAVKDVLKDLPVRLYLQIRTESDRSVAQQVQRLLAGSNLTVPGIELVNTGPSTSEIRYYHASDQPEAVELARKLTAAGIPTVPKDSSAFAKTLNSRVPEKQIELWLAPGVKFTEPA